MSFEIGLQQELSRDWALNVTAYSKDITNLTSSYYYFVGRDYTIFINADYARVQGIDVTLDKRFSDYYSGRVTYSLLSAIGNQSDPMGGYDYRAEDAPLRPNRNYPLDFDQRHKITATLTTRLPEGSARRSSECTPSNGSPSAIFMAGSGLPYTPTSRAAEETGIVPEPNSARRPWTYKLDLKISREFRSQSVPMTAFFDIDNVFDAVNTTLCGVGQGSRGTKDPHPFERRIGKRILKMSPQGASCAPVSISNSDFTGIPMNRRFISLGPCSLFLACAFVTARRRGRCTAPSSCTTGPCKTHELRRRSRWRDDKGAIAESDHELWNLLTLGTKMSEMPRPTSFLISVTPERISPVWSTTGACSLLSNRTPRTGTGERDRRMDGQRERRLHRKRRGLWKDTLQPGA